MQQPPGVMNMMPQFPPANITTEQIQKYLDENKKLILAILDNQNLGKLAECAQYQAQLQKNLMYLAAIADAQPPAPAVPVPSQIPAHPAMQQGGHYMQHPQAAMGQQPSGFPSKIPMQFNPQQMQEQQQQLQHQHQQAIQGHLGMRPVVSNGLQGMHGEVNHGGGSGIGPSTTSGVTEYTRSCAGAGVSASVGATPGVAGGGGASSNPTHARVGKQDGKEAGSSEAQGNTAAGNSSGNGEKVNTKGSGDA